VNGQADKGDTYRPVDRRKFARIYGVECPRCHGTGNDACTVHMDGTHPPCIKCNGLGYVKKDKSC